MLIFRHFRDEADGKTRITVERKIHRTFLGPAASSATRELDDLMASLSDAKVSRFLLVVIIVFPLSNLILFKSNAAIRSNALKHV
jgi:hypothetical protein